MQPRAAAPGTDGVHTVALVIDEDQHRPLAGPTTLVVVRITTAPPPGGRSAARVECGDLPAYGARP
ncbi:hypothetical protein ABZV75_36240 [Streptomyces flaveolus]|uniref:hypothetical protein n=1 Tax=Streptomyces flaveolus TaxID=67297 RepID=UPI0033BBF7F8